MDASAEHMGASLQQQMVPVNLWEPLGFFSKKLDRACLACVSGICHFCHFLNLGPFDSVELHR